MTQTAKTYGESLYELARDEELSAEILEQLEETASILKDNDKYEELLLLPSVPKEERCGLIDGSFGGRVHKYVLNFLKILIENGTIREFYGCVEAFRSRYYEDNGIVAVSAVSAMPLSDKLRNKLIDKLESVTGKTVVLTIRIDPSVIGGIKLDMEGSLYDGTIATRLGELQKVLSDLVL